MPVLSVNHAHPSPNFNHRMGTTIDTIIVHYTDMENCFAAIDRLCDPSTELSAHYVISSDGVIYQLVDEEHRAWHAGVSSWLGENNINDRSIGIELDYPGHSCSPKGCLPPYPEQQIDALIDLIKDIRTRHQIPNDRILGHEDVAPERKIDPGSKFPWNKIRT